MIRDASTPETILRAGTHDIGLRAQRHTRPTLSLNVLKGHPEKTTFSNHIGFRIQAGEAAWLP